MRAILFNDTVHITEMPQPVPKPGEALVRVTTTGVCNTDLEIFKGYMGFRGVPGHEFVGVVESCSNDHLIGKRVVGEINCPCGACRYCQMELPHHCTERTVLGISGRNGSFADYLTLPEENLHLVPDDLPDEAAVFVEPLAAAFRILEQVDIGEEHRVVVLGDGKLGQLATQVVWLRSRRVLCIGRHPWKLDILRQLKIDTALADDPVEPGADVVIEATGSPSGFQRALELVRPEGTIVLKTTVAGSSMMNLALPVVNEVRIIGSRCGPFRPALEALALGTVEVRPLVSAIYTLDQGAEAMARAAESDVLKVLMRAS